MNKKFALSVCVVLVAMATVRANIIVGLPNKAPRASTRTSTGDCVAGASQTDLYINDVRARMLDDGDKWWDLNVAHYIVPQVSEGQTAVSSIFAGAIWIGGIDPGGQLKIAAATYRQNGNDWFPGPIPANGQVKAAICSAFDNHWQVFGDEIAAFLATPFPKGNGDIPNDILNWPAVGNTNNAAVNSAGPNVSLAPFYDADDNGIYDPQNGDYPIIQPSSTACGCVKPEYADQMIWWCYNDLGNVHTESNGIPIGMQVNEEAWAYKTNDEINDMTFYHYKIINTATTELDSTFMGQWVDPDLGCYLDDYVGCDPVRGLGVDYNGQAFDGAGGDCPSSFPNYGDQPPMVGTVYFQGPSYRYKLHPGSTTDTVTHDTCLKMSDFIWYNNDFTAIGNPIGASQYYGYLSGTWKDGTPVTFGGNGHGGTQKVKYMFPNDPTDNSAGAWSECEANDIPGDRRYLQSSGPFKLLPGSVNDIVIGAVWVRPPIGTYPCPSFSLIDKASDKAQALFDNCFEVINGPDAPDVTITELDQQLVLNLVNTNSATVEGYSQRDPTIGLLGVKDSFFRFQGYLIYQLINNQVTPQNYGDLTQSKLIAQCDIKDGVSSIINYIYSAQLNANIPTLMVQGADAGIKHTFDITTDAFALSNPQLVNFQPYYFSVISYAYNNYDTTIKGIENKQLLPYLAGRKNIAVYTGIPHKPSPEANGTLTNSVYGNQPFITRQLGQGNGGNFLDLTTASVDAILNSPDGFYATPTYKEEKGPIVVKVIDPKRVPADSFTVALNDTAAVITKQNQILSNSSDWLLTNVTESTSGLDTIQSNESIAVGNEQIIAQWGLSIYISQVLGPGYDTLERNGFISSEVDYDNPKNQWLGGLANEAQPSSFHWILSGTYNPTGKNGQPNFPNRDWVGVDDNQYYAGIAGGTWAPYVLASFNTILGATPTYRPTWKDPFGFAYRSSNSPLANIANTPPSKLSKLNSVDIVFTSDKTKWSKCIVVEEQVQSLIAENNAPKMSLRRHASWTGDVDGSGNPTYDNTSNGFSYFPGYAINVETGQRLNIFFGEDSWQVGQNGNDMIWNPSANQFSATGDTLLGGQHYVYVDSLPYDGCQQLYTNLSLNSTIGNRAVYSTVEWVGMTYLAPGATLLPLSQGIIPTTATVKIRVAKPYQTFSNLGNASPVYSFGLKNLAADTADNTMAKNAMDSIEVVPNPYYAYSNYEQSALDNEIKFTNLPQVCTITIYTLDGQLVNTINYTGPFTTAGKFNNLESTNWNLTNSAGVPVASGVYLIYFSSPTLGTRCIKWFGVRRPIDIGNF